MKNSNDIIWNRTRDLPTMRCYPIFLSFDIKKTSMHYQLSYVIRNNNTSCIVIYPYGFIGDLQHTKRFTSYHFVNPFRPTRNPKQDRQCTCNVTTRRVLSTTVTVEKQYVLHILSLCLQPQLSCMQSACAVLYCHLACMDLQNFSTLSHKRHDFWQYRYWT